MVRAAPQARCIQRSTVQSLFSLSLLNTISMCSLKPQSLARSKVTPKCLIAARTIVHPKGSRVALALCNRKGASCVLAVRVIAPFRSGRQSWNWCRNRRLQEDFREQHLQARRQGAGVWIIRGGGTARRWNGQGAYVVRGERLPPTPKPNKGYRIADRTRNNSGRGE